MSNDGTMKSVYFVRHRKTGEIRFVKTGEKYNQQEWDLVSPVEVPQELKQSS